MNAHVMVEGEVFRFHCLLWARISLEVIVDLFSIRQSNLLYISFFQGKVTPRKLSLVVAESFVSPHPHFPGMSGCMDRLLRFTVFPHLLPKAKVLPTQSTTQYKQLLCLVLVGPSLGYVHKKIFLFQQENKLKCILAFCPWPRGKHFCGSSLLKY